MLISLVKVLLLCHAFGQIIQRLFQTWPIERKGNWKDPCQSVKISLNLKSNLPQNSHYWKLVDWRKLRRSECNIPNCLSNSLVWKLINLDLYKRRQQQFRVYGVRYVYTRYAICYLNARVYSSSAFRNACSSSNPHSVVIAILWGSRPPYWNIGGAIAPLTPLCRCPCIF